MDWFGLLLDCLSVAGQGVMHIFFVERLTGKERALRHFAAYLLLLGMIQLASAGFALGEILSVAMGVLALYAVSRFGMGNQPSASWLAAVLAFYISQLSFGILNSVEAAVLPGFVGSPLLYLLLLLAQALFFGLCLGCYRAVRKLLTWTEDGQTPYIGLLLFPGLFFLTAELYILQTAYSVFAPTISLEEVGRHSTLLLLQVMGLAALLCTLYAYRQLCRGFQAQAEVQSLTQASRAQKVYIAEAQLRYERTRAFRHDVKNHLSVLDGLLRSGKTEEGRAYLQKLEAVSEALSFPYQTGNPVVDILLGEKLALAEDLAAEVSLVLPRPCGIDDFDLCVLFANALDNAISACRACQGTGFVRVAGKRQGDFYLLMFENSCPDGPLPPAGTGMDNIRTVAEKYRGAVLTEKADGQFSLHVLLDIS
jgi:hypothetical protein